MASYNSVLSGELHRSVDNVTYFKRKGKKFVKKKIMTTSSKSKKQIEHRNKFKKIVDFSQIFPDIYPIGFIKLNNGQSAFNEFVKNNLQAVNSDGKGNYSIDYQKLVMANGKDKEPDVNMMYKDGNIRIIQSAQEPTVASVIDDIVYVVLLETVYESARIIKLKERQTNSTSIFELPKKWKIENMVGYAFAVSDSKRRASKTLVIDIEIDNE